VPVVPIKKSATPDFLICLEDGHKFKTLKQHLMGHCGLTPKEYRAKWGLPSDYPMVAQNYALSRSKLAKSIGLGKKLRSLETSDAPVPGSKRKKLGLKFSD
jgi:predicted transcriptional regulator